MKKIIKTIKHFIRLMAYYIITRIQFIKNGIPKVYSSLDSIKIINNQHLSVTRFGDGEFMIIKKKSLKFQEYDAELAEKLEKILYSKPKNLAICIPDIYKFSVTRSLKYDEEVFWLNQIIHYSDIYLNKNLHQNIYYDSCLTRPYIRYKKATNSKNIFNEIKNIWDNQDILIVEGEFSRLGVGNNLFDNAKSISRILCPSKNAYNSYSEILKKTIKYSKNKLVIIALGPTATVLSYELNERNIRAIDLGHLDLEYEWFLAKSTKKVLVKNKSVNEVEEEDDLDTVKDAKYLESIICKIK